MLKLFILFSAAWFLLGHRPEALAEGAGTKAIGGRPAPPGTYPFQVALLKTDAYGEGPYPADEPLRALACAGTLIGGRWVLTAAHCVAWRWFDPAVSSPQAFPPANCLPEATGDICVYRADALLVLVGTQELLPGKGRRFGIKRIIVEPHYRQTANEHDIALIELNDQVAGYPGVLLADNAFSEHAATEGSLARAVGWGLVDETYGPNSVFLKEIDIPVQPLEGCRERHRLYEAWVDGTAWHEIDIDSMVTKNMICTGWDGPPPDPDGEAYDGEVLPNVCFGDSGGFVGLPDRDGSWVQIGIPSWLRDCKTPYIFSVHTKVSAYRDWIALKTRLPLPAPVAP